MTCVCERDDLSEVGVVARVSQIAGGPFEQPVKAVFGIPLSENERDSLAAQSWCCKRQEEALSSGPASSQIREPGVNEYSPGQAENPKARRTESVLDPSRDGGSPRNS